ncbi:hypothetical protein C1645_821160 [Glomus cerebriforme]|uniref:Uncharacterized protein n=1 Tax=Glomus cerebriforme TaxID=658196 RepID=A0A397T1P4_9GLOM|nr:hypothetical protein C1645_821160 [Glomus cerebriforme]
MTPAVRSRSAVFLGDGGTGNKDRKKASLDDPGRRTKEMQRRTGSALRRTCLLDLSKRCGQ